MLRDLFGGLTMTVRFAFGLQRYLREKMTFQEAREAIKERMRHREENFLKIVRKGIFGYERSPYLPLLKRAGCAYEDVERMVSKNGVETSLKLLKEDGVYFTIQEFKGKRSVSRKGLEFAVKEKDFDNPYTQGSFETRSGGTRSAGTRISIDFEFFSAVAANKGLTLEFYGLSGAPIIVLRPAFPFGAGMKMMMTFSKFGIHPVRNISFFKREGVSFKNRAALFYIMTIGNLVGARFLRPEFIDYQDIGKVVGIIDEINREHGKCVVATNVSSAVRMCLAAKAQGVGFQGVVFQGGGEPLTPQKLRAIEERGARYIVKYAFSEAGGVVGCQCLAPAATDDVHLFKDFISLISYKKEARDGFVNAFLATMLLPSSPKIMLNVENGDCGTIEDRICGCPIDDLGYNTHVHGIRSFEKLTDEGMTFYGTDLVRIIEEVLPAKFGGNALTYQIVEETDENGLSRLVLAVDPAAGPMDESALVKTVLSELGKGGESQKMMAQVWSRLETIKVRRAAPSLTKMGKLYPLYINSRRHE